MDCDKRLPPTAKSMAYFINDYPHLYGIAVVVSGY